MAHSLLRITIAIGEPSVRPCRMPPRSSSSSCSKRIRGPAAVTETAPRELVRDVVGKDGKAGGHALDRDHEGRTVGLARRQEAQHGVLRSDVRLDSPQSYGTRQPELRPSYARRHPDYGRPAPDRSTFAF